jgi:hypothetical protein
MLYRAIKKCRVCGNRNLELVLDLGQQALTGIFPKPSDPAIPKGPLELVFCPDCTLVQMKHTYNPEQLYGQNYGYRSGLNKSMVRHLNLKAEYLTRLATLKSGDRILDIGSNDGTLLGAYSIEGLYKLGIDPTAGKFRKYYKESINLVEDFFSVENYRRVAGEKQAALVTSIAMFYDLESPVGFARDVRKILADDGVWHFEQSYLPTMLRMNSFDTVCHEHSEYYSLHSIQEILERAEMKILDVTFNDINGGSFAVTACRKNSSREPNTPLVEWVLESEKQSGIDTAAPIIDFAKGIPVKAQLLVDLLKRLATAGKTVIGYGASTKGNVLLQYAGITGDLLQAIAEVNTDKFGHVTPGTKIPIISDEQARAMKPEFFLVLPWHFRNDILSREHDFIREGGKFIFPLPEPEIV